MKSQSNNQELTPAELLDKYFRTYNPYDGETAQTLEYLNAYYRQLALSCLPERIDTSDYPVMVTVEWVRQHPVETEKLCFANGQNAAIDTIEQNIRAKFQ